MDTLSEDILNSFITPALDDFVEYADRIRTVLRGARKIGQGVPRGVDFLSADVVNIDPPEAHEHSKYRRVTAYVPVAEMEDDSIRLFGRLSGGEKIGVRVPRPARHGSLKPEDLPLTEEWTEYSTVPPSKAAPRLDESDLLTLHAGSASATAWIEWLHPYLKEILDREPPAPMRFPVNPATVTEGGGIVTTGPSTQAQKLFRPDGSIFDVGQAGLMIGMGGRVKHDAPDELDVPEPIRSRAEEISERKRRREAELEAEAARREFAR